MNSRKGRLQLEKGAWPTVTLRKKLFVLLLFFSIMPILLVGLIETRKGRQILEQQIGVCSVEYARLLLQGINEYIYSKFEDVISWTHVIGAEDMADIKHRAKISDFLRHMVATSDDYYYALVLDGTGSVVASSTPALVGMNYSGGAGFQKALNGEPHIQDVAWNAPAHGYAVVISSPVMDFTEHRYVIGVILVALKWQRVNEKVIGLEIAGRKQTVANHIMLFDSRGLVISCFIPEEMFETNLIDIGMKSAKNAVQKKEGFLTEISEHDLTSFSAYTYSRKHASLPDLGWGMVLLQDTDSVFAPVASLKRTTVSTLLILIVALFVISYLFGKRISKPILTVASAAKAFGKGEFGSRVRVASSDEVGVLADSFNKMAENVERSSRELRETQARFSDFFRNAPIGFHIFGPDQIITDINEAELDMIGYTRDEIVGKKTWADLIIPAQAEQFKKHWNDIMRKGNVRDLEYTLIHKQGRHIDVLLNASSRFDEIGQFINSRGSILNITERKRSQEQIQNLARFPSENPSPVLRIAADGTLLYANDASESILEKWGCREGEAVLDEWCGIISDVFDTREEKRIEREYAGRVLSFMITPVIEAGYANLYCRDTTERKRAEESLKLRFDLEELLTSISTEFINLEPDEIDDGIDRALETIADVSCVDRAYIFLYSHEGDRMSNTHEFCRTGVPPHKDRLQDVPVEMFPWFDRRIKSLETVVVDSVAKLTKEADTGKDEWLLQEIQSLLCVPMISRDHLIGFVGFDTVLYETQWREEIITFLKILSTVFANTLDRKQVGQERQHLLKTLAAKNEELQSIVYVASHDLKSPLVNIQGFSGELAASCEHVEAVLHDDKTPVEIQQELDSVLDEDIPESLSFIRAGTTKMQALLNGLLEVSRTGTATIEIKAIDMNEMMDLIITGMRFQITESGADVTVDDLPECIGDKDHINQVFTNLLTNAVKYLDPNRKGVIHVTGRVEDRDAIYCVEDNGLGIAPAHQPKVFELFHRLEPNGEVKGEGLGLTIARRILDREGGNIWVESKTGKGSSFFVSLPRM